jgi:pimeloyl-ACP methyl ester carboxylesterase
MSAPVMLATHEWPPVGTDAGAAAPVAVLVHGITGWWRTWWRVGPALADLGWRVIAIDQRGHGESPAIDRVATAKSLAADLALTIEGVGAGPLDVLVAHSLGGAVSMELIADRPELARRLVIEDPPGQDRRADPEYQATLEREVRAARAASESEVRREMAGNPTWLEEDARQNVEGRVLCDVDGVLASLRGGTGLRVVELAPNIQVPTLYILADEQRSAIGAQRSALVASLPAGSSLVELESGHTVHRDRFDAYMATLVAWLADA